MKQCGQCGTQNLDQQASCTGCGQPLPAASPSHALGGTLVLQPPEPPAVPAAAPAPARPNNLKGTMIGMAPPTFSSPHTPAAPVPAATVPSEPPAAGGSQPPRAFSGTMLGMPAYPSPPPAPDVPPPAPAPPGGAAPRIASAQKTVLGVARPGIAPLNPGQAKPAPAVGPVVAAPNPSLQAPPAAWQPPPATAIAEGPRSPRAGAPGRVSLTAALAMMGSAMLLVIAVLAFFMLRGHGSVTARASLDANGAEQLELSCSECPDGTKTWIDSSPVAFRAGKATLRLRSPLKVGENPIVLVLERPGRSREEIALAIPIEFRVRGSTDELAQDHPKVAIVVNALAGSKLELDGKPVAIDPSGASSRFEFDVSTELTGPEASVKSLERVVPYKATSPSGAVQSGKVEIRLGITPLVVDAPGASIIVGGKDIVLAGRTAPGAVLKVGAREVALDPEGRFVSKQPLSAGDNSFVVRSTLKDHAPRLVKVQVRRSDNLEREGSLARAMAQASYAEVMRAGDSAAGRVVALDGQLFDLRHDGYSSVLLVDVKDGCKKAPCLAKVIYGVETQLEKGRNLKAFGKVVRFVDGPRTGQRIPEVRADLVVAGAP
jgi:hypothetical protein